MTISTDITYLVRDILAGYVHKDRRNTRCIVFVHGVLGDMQLTWKSNGSPGSFLQLVFQDAELQDYDVFSFGYRSSYLRGAPIDNAAIQLRTALSYLDKDRYSVVLIAHSMGGLVCMKYIVDELQRSTTPPVSGLLLYGTPTTGSDLVNIAKLIGFGIGLKLPIVRSIFNGLLSSQRQVADLATGSEFLTRLHSEWAYRVVNGGHEKAGQQRMWLPVRVITGEDDLAVKEASGKGVYGAIDWQPLSYGHMKLVKPDGPTDIRYLAAKSFLQLLRRVDPQVLDRVWKASQSIWAYRTARVSESLGFFTAIHEKQEIPESLLGVATLKGFCRCETICEYDVILEAESVEFGVSFGDNDLWRRESLPVYVHQIGLNLLPQGEKDALRSSIEAVITRSTDDQVWSLFFPKLSLSVDGTPLTGGEFLWPANRQFGTWVLRKYTVPDASRSRIGSKVRLKISYDSIIPVSLSHFTFSAPWIVHGIKAQVVVLGSFEYFVPSHRLVPPGRMDQDEERFGERREVKFRYDGIMLPGSAIEVRWRRQGSAASDRSQSKVGD